jgi:hypothetical protein
MGTPVMRDWLYRSGDLFLPRKYVDYLDTYIIGDSKSLFYVNYWTILHVLSGVAGSFFISLEVFHALHFIWEMWQIFIGMTPISVRGFIDLFVDTFAAHLGYLSTQFAKYPY